MVIQKSINTNILREISTKGGGVNQTIYTHGNGNGNSNGNGNGNGQVKLRER